MDAIPYSTAREKLVDTMERVCDSHDPVIITRRGARAVVMVDIKAEGVQEAARAIGARAFAWEGSRWFNKRAFDQAHAFYERYGGVTLVAARFMPFVRTFAPFVAGVAQMTRARFTMYDVSGGALWVGGVITVGYFFGNVPFVKAHLDKIIWAMIFIPGVLVLLGSWRARSKRLA